MNNIKERIIQESAILFARQGCKAITMDDIATSMGISKRTIYENFSDKRDLLLQCMEYFFQQIQYSIDTILKSSDNIFDSIFKTIKCESDSISQAKFNFFNEIKKYFPDVYESTVSIFRKHRLENMEEMLKKGRDDKVIKKDIDLKIIIALLQEFEDLIFNSDTFLKYGYDKPILIHTFMYIFIYGICTEKGVKILDKKKPFMTHLHLMLHRCDF